MFFLEQVQARSLFIVDIILYNRVGDILEPWLVIDWMLLRVRLGEEYGEMNAASLLIHEAIEQRADGATNVLLLGTRYSGNPKTYGRRRHVWPKVIVRSICGFDECIRLALSLQGVQALVAFRMIEEERSRVATVCMAAVLVREDEPRRKANKDPESG